MVQNDIIKKSLKEYDGLPEAFNHEIKKINIVEVIHLKKDSDKITVAYNDIIENTPAFNAYVKSNFKFGEIKVFTKKQLITLIRTLNNQLNSMGLDEMSMVCMGTECVRWASCSLQLSGIDVPEGDPCPIEKTEATTYVQKICQEYKADIATFADRLIVSELAACHLIKTRILASMAITPDPVISVGKGVDRSGEVITDKVENPHFRALDNIISLEQKLLKSLSITRDQQIRKEANSVGIKSEDDVLGLYNRRLRDMQAESVDIIDISTNNGAETSWYGKRKQERGSNEKEVRGESNFGGMRAVRETDGLAIIPTDEHNEESPEGMVLSEETIRKAEELKGLL